MLNHNGRRYAIYFSPERGDPLERFGASWLGRDAWTGESLSRPAVDGFNQQELDRLTSSPRGYGFHATLKPPFRLAAGKAREELMSKLQDLAASTAPFCAPPLTLAVLGRFTAFELSSACPSMEELADACVRHFDDFRAPATAAELARRKELPLPPRQLELLDRWGYPYVLDQWQFHLSLTGSYDSATAERARQALLPLTGKFTNSPWPVDGIFLFEQEDETAPFLVTARFPFEGTRS